MSNFYETRSARARRTTSTSTMTLYVLKCADSCWYVGITGNLKTRWNQHAEGRGAEWTKVHAPLSIHSQREVPSESATHEEAVVTSEMMLKYGINKVRGASLTYSRPYDTRESDVRRVAGCIRKALDLNYTEVRETVLEELEREAPAKRYTSPVNESFDEVGLLASVFNGFNIGGTSAKGVSGSRSTAGTNNYARNMTTRSSAVPACTRCGRSSHTRGQCYASTHISGRKIWGTGCEKCGRNSHTVATCYAKTDLDGNRI